MKELFAKRFIFLSRGIIGLFALAVILMLHKLNAGDQRRNLEMLDRVKEAVDKSEQVAEPARQDSLNRTWMKAARPGAWDSNYQFRVRLKQVLSGYGITGLDDGEHTVRMSLLKAHADTSQDRAGVRPKKLSILIDDFIRLSWPITIRYAVAVDTSALGVAVTAKKLEMEQFGRVDGNDEVIEYGDEANEEKGVFSGGADLVEGDSFRIAISYLVSGQGREDKVMVPGGANSIVAPSKLALLGMENSTATDTVTLRKLGAVYGELDYSDARELIVTESIQAYESFEILGFSFPTPMLPFAMVFFHILLGLGIIQNLQLLLRNRLVLFDSDLVEDVFEPVINRKGLRFVVWILLPLLSVYLSLPVYPMSATRMIVLGFLVSLLFIINITGFVLSKKKSDRTGNTA